MYRLLKAHDLITSPAFIVIKLNNLTPADVYFGRGHKILSMREKIKRETIQRRRLTHFESPA